MLSLRADPPDYTQVQPSLELSTFSFFRRPGMRGMKSFILQFFYSTNKCFLINTSPHTTFKTLKFIFLIFVSILWFPWRPPSPHKYSAPLWCMKGEGKFSRTLNIFFFIHCTGLCLYRILIAREKTIPSLRRKNNIFNEKILFQWEIFFMS